MPIRMVLDERARSCPQVFCDWCGRQIADAREGNYEWEVSGCQPVTGELIYLHKQCSRPHEKAKGGHWFSNELQQLPLYLCRNIEVHERDLVKIGKDADSCP